MIKKISLTIAGLLVAGFLYIDVSGDKFREKVQREVRQITQTTVSASVQKFTPDQLTGLPEPVQRYFNYVLKDGQEYIRIAKLKQTGEFRVKESDRWVPLEAEQYSVTESPSFVWHARLRSMPYAWIDARDVYHNGKGFTESRLLSAVPLMFETGKEMELSSLVRFLSEAPWYPTALLPGRHLEWKSLDSHSAKAIISDAGYSVSAVFTFGDGGEITKVTTNSRYRNLNGKKEQLPWTAYYSNYKAFHNVKIPTDMEAEWNLQEGNFTYARLKLAEISYNNP